MTGHLILVDASGFAHRAFHAGNPTYRSDGLPTWAITGFLAMLWRLRGAAQADEPTHAACVFDAPGKTFRHDLYPPYKTNRPARDAELGPQLPYLRHCAETMGFASVEMEGFEADDVIATLAHRANISGLRTTIVSSDKDFCQCVIDGAIHIVDPMQHKRLGVREVMTKFGVPPAQVQEVQAIAGDRVDNIPGADGIGLKGAARMIRRWQNIEGVMAALKPEWAHFTPKERQILKQTGLGALKLFRDLTTLRADAPLRYDIELAVQPIMREHVDQILETLEATKKFEAIFGFSPQIQRVSEKIAGELDWWQRALTTPRLPVPPEPQCGYYQTRLVSGGPWVPARIWRDPEKDFITGQETGMDLLQCLVGTSPKDPVHEWERLARYPIKQDHYEYMRETVRWARVHAPHEPEADPTKPIDWNKVELR